MLRPRRRRLGTRQRGVRGSADDLSDVDVVLPGDDLSAAGGGGALPHCPQRRIFGARYLARDLPGPVCERLEALAFVRDLADLAVKREAAHAWFGRCMERLREHGPGSGLPDEAG
ncbi:MAG: hypothetical protein ABIO45_00165 [Burkholderiaceae bacterium]